MVWDWHEGLDIVMTASGSPGQLGAPWSAGGGQIGHCNFQVDDSQKFVDMLVEAFCANP